MKLDDLDRKLDRLRAAAQRISANLVELEVDSDRQLLEATELEGNRARAGRRRAPPSRSCGGGRGCLRPCWNAPGGCADHGVPASFDRCSRAPRSSWRARDVPLAERQLLGSSQIFRAALQTS